MFRKLGFFRENQYKEGERKGREMWEGYMRDNREATDSGGWGATSQANSPASQSPSDAASMAQSKTPASQPRRPVAEGLNPGEHWARYQWSKSLAFWCPRAEGTGRWPCAGRQKLPFLCRGQIFPIQLTNLPGSSLYQKHPHRHAQKLCLPALCVCLNLGQQTPTQQPLPCEWWIMNAVEV